MLQNLIISALFQLHGYRRKRKQSCISHCNIHDHYNKKRRFVKFACHALKNEMHELKKRSHLPGKLPDQGKKSDR